MQYYRPKRKEQNNLIIIAKYAFLLAFTVFFAIYAYYFINNLIVVFLSVFIVLLAILFIISKFFMSYFMRKGHYFIAVMTDVFFVIVAIPAALISGFILPYSILIVFFNIEGLALIRGLIFTIVLFQLVFTIYFVNRKLKDVDMGIITYVSYFFNIKRRVEEAKAKKLSTQKSKNFFDNLHLVEERIISNKSKDPTPFDEFDWKQRFDDIMLADSTDINYIAKDSSKKTKKTINKSDE